MKAFRTLFLTSAVVVFAAGLAEAAGAQDKIDQPTNAHVMSLRLADGSTERIRYWGDRPPVVTFGGQTSAMEPVFGAFDMRSPFAELERMSAEMDRQAAAMLQQAGLIDRVSSAQGSVFNIDFGKLPPGTHGYSVVSTVSNGHTCTETLRYFNPGSGKPQVDRSRSGNCGAVQGHASEPFPALAPKPAAKSKPANVIEAKYRSAAPEEKSGSGGLQVAGLF